MKRRKKPIWDNILEPSSSKLTKENYCLHIDRNKCYKRESYKNNKNKENNGLGFAKGLNKTQNTK